MLVKPTWLHVLPFAPSSSGPWEAAEGAGLGARVSSSVCRWSAEGPLSPLIHGGGGGDLMPISRGPKGVRSGLLKGALGEGWGQWRGHG